ncbi:transmembrane amino acid transporter protein-domain-containing protein [Irpex rosettiformis]|uniref:Transmembrane amino acid transporter protein-domain-containing protein n=1 Tax=Irpex rosettiformis TaxID=378272 RepID=A0ACB8UJZ6_9APHY|nr:transmembrane amino acid transporter protein-domain-containing protein [Irpex rosettiformis]
MSSFDPGSYASSRFRFGTPSTSGVRDAFQAFRRSQYYLADSVSASPSQTDLDFEHDDVDYEEQSVIEESIDEEAGIGIPSSTPPPRSYDPNAAIGNLQWDEDLTPGPSTVAVSSGGAHPGFLSPAIMPPRPIRHVTDETIVPSPRNNARENTPLLHKVTSLTFAEPRRPAPPNASDGALVPMPIDGPPVTLTRRVSQVSTRSGPAVRRGSTASRATKAIQAGQSTSGQTLFNAIAILLGIGMLSEPLAFAYAGWIGGFLLITFYGWITCYTAKILAHMILDDPKLRSYSDIGRKAFGARMSPIISTLFCLELFTVSVALVTLYADSLHSVWPTYSTNTYKIVGLLILVPTTLMPLSLLSYASILGILSTIYLIVVMFIDGFSKPEGLGSLWTPAETSLSFGSLGGLGLSFGLFMAGLSGHAVIPSLAHDMIDPSQFDHMIEWAFAIATLIYTIIGVTGYIMFGNEVSDEFSQDLMTTPGFNLNLNKVALWGLVIAPLSKFALSTRPLNLTLEIILGIETSGSSPDDHDISSSDSKPQDPGSDAATYQRKQKFKYIVTVIERALLTSFSVAVSILVPEFSSMMAFLGSFSAFLICVIGPVSAKVALAGRCGLWDGVLLVTAVAMAAWGTGAAFWSAKEGGI